MKEHELSAPITTLQRAENAESYESTLGIQTCDRQVRQPAADWILERE